MSSATQNWPQVIIYPMGSVGKIPMTAPIDSDTGYIGEQALAGPCLSNPARFFFFRSKTGTSRLCRLEGR